MTSVTAEFELLLNSFDKEPSACSKVLREYAQANPAGFVADARDAMLRRAPSRALSCLARLLTPEGLLRILLQVYAGSRNDAIALARKLLICEPRFDIALIEYVEDKRLADASEETVLSAMDILDEVSERERLVLNVLTFLKHPNPRLRSKAARLIGRRRPNAAWMNDLLLEPDARVRANAIESLFTWKNDFAHALFRASARDENNRVAGNARLGLYLFGDTGSVALIDELARDSRPNFRNTGAWVIGQTRDCRFSPTLSELLTDQDELVRKQAFHSLGEIRKSIKTMAGKPALQISVLKHEECDGRHNLVTAIYDAWGRPVKDIPGTGLCVKVDGRFVRNYDVKQHDCANSLDIAFVLCLPKDGEDAIKVCLENAVQQCIPLRRPNDRWAVVKLTRNSYWARFGQPGSRGSLNAARGSGFEYSAHPGQIDLMLKERPAFISGAVEDDAMYSIMRDLLSAELGTESRHIILVGKDPNPQFLELLRKRRQSLRFTVHAAMEPGDQIRLLQGMTEKTGGSYHSVSDPAQFGQAVADSYASLVHYYGIEWRAGGSRIDLEVNTEAGRGTATYLLKEDTLPAPHQAPADLARQLPEGITG